MPRKAKPPVAPYNTGSIQPAAQPAQAATGQAYGERGQQMQAQQAMPLPDLRAGGMGDPMAEVEQAALGMPAPMGGLNAPTSRPTEPVTAGLGLGPGVGPEAVFGTNRTNEAADLLDRVAMATGDPDLQMLADRARR